MQTPVIGILLQGGRGQGFIHWTPHIWQKQTTRSEFDAGNCNMLQPDLPLGVLTLTCCLQSFLKKKAVDTVADKLRVQFKLE